MFLARHAGALASPLARPAWSSLARADGGMVVFMGRKGVLLKEIRPPIRCWWWLLLSPCVSIIASPNYRVQAQSRVASLSLDIRVCATPANTPHLQPPTSLAPSFHPALLPSTWDGLARRRPAPLEQPLGQPVNAVMSHNMKDSLETERKGASEKGGDREGGEGG